MAIQLTGDLERRLREAARRRGTDIESTVAALLSTEEEETDSVSAARRIREEALRQEFAVAMQDPLFVEDLTQTMRAYESVDLETVGLALDD